MGEFGAVSVVAGHIRGLTNTMPLYIEILQRVRLLGFIRSCVVTDPTRAYYLDCTAAAEPCWSG
jgi:hypothetical protein